MLILEYQKSVLIVDDESVNRQFLGTLLQKENYNCFFSENGKEAINLFQQKKPDLVLMDTMMPVMDGYEAAKQIKALVCHRFVPIIFFTAVTDHETLIRCVENGDDVLEKPYNSILLCAKIEAMDRFRRRYAQLSQQKESLELYQSEIQYELEFSEQIFKKMISRAALELPYLKFWTSAMSKSQFSGDLLFTARKPAGGLHVLLCDFTGHGLSAAMGALPVSDIFIEMTHHGCVLLDIISEINKKINQALPTGFFCAAAFMDVDALTSTLQIWNAGLPDVVVLDSHENQLHRIASRYLPLGISNQFVADNDVDIYPVTRDQKLFIYTDGLIEVVNDDNEMYGYERLERCLLDFGKNDSFMDEIKQDVLAFCGFSDPHDDLTCVRLDCFSAISDLTSDQVDKQKN
ncbi:MAG: fused response regulator/phosphatase [Gammaproteobacteria bacterium]|nr:fused response regulator/phosphatase [Gammaproteobacteria bacterium]